MNLKHLFVYSLLFLLNVKACHSQTAVPVAVTPIPQFQAFDQSGRPLAFGCVFTYTSQTTSPLATYSDFTGTIQNPNPVPLSASGSANIWIKSGQVYTFAVKSAGGTNCSLGTLMYSVDGIGSGAPQTVTPIASSATPAFAVISQFQVFTLTITQNTVGLPVTFVNVQAPALITFQITQDGTGGWTFAWPTNVTGGVPIDSTANHTTTQTFVWNGTSILPVGSGFTSAGNGILSTTIINPLIFQSALLDQSTLTATKLFLTSPSASSISSTGNGTQLSVQSANGTSGNTPGGVVSIGTGNGIGAADGGAFNVTSGSSGTTGNGGAINFTTGNGNGGGNAGGSIVLNPGGGGGGASGGTVQINGIVSKYNSANTVGNGLAAEYALVDLTAQSATIPTTTLLTAPATALYRVQSYSKITTAATTSSTIFSPSILYTDGADSTSQSAQLGCYNAFNPIAMEFSDTSNTTGTALICTGVIWAKSGTTISYNNGYSSTGATAMQYELHLRLERF